MNRCIELAKKAHGNTYPNPLVGSVIVHNGVIIGEGYHKKAGEPHAEINAINSVKNKDLLQKSTIFVSLEPCSHFGKTPPCANKIVECGIPNVVIGSLDPHEKVNGNGKRILKNAGINVVSGVLEKECEILNKRFFTFQKRKRPFILLKWAQSADGFIDKDFQPVQISNALSSQFVHQLRAEEHAILVGTQTALRDNPSLSTRNVFGRNPIRILIDKELKVPGSFNIYNKEAETIVVNCLKEGKEGNIRFVKIKKVNFLENLMQKLFTLQIQSVLVEGGAFTLQQFINSNFWDEAIVIKNPNLFLNAGTISPKLNGKIEKTHELRGNFVEKYRNYSF
jgi:diaminohydroxyphosphoribosylaminopyrimidine deaminase/5-amino-6-(5-phosphoribosylamino)uracil reductase